MDRRHLLLSLLVPLVAAGCLGRSSHKVTPVTTVRPPTTTTAAAARTSLTVFRVEAGKLTARAVSVPKTAAPAGASLKALGIDANVTIANGTATVDLPDATAGQVAEIVLTLTQYPSVQRVDVGGKTGLTATGVDQSLLPQILVESPAAGAVVPQTFHVTGLAQVFEATFVVELRISGQVAVKETVMASEGAPGRGTFDAALTSPARGAAEIVAYEPSAADGRPLHTVTVPITIGP